MPIAVPGGSGAPPGLLTKSIPACIAAVTYRLKTASTICSRMESLGTEPIPLLEPGDIAIFGGFTPHRSADNTSQESRRDRHDGDVSRPHAWAGDDHRTVACRHATGDAREPGLYSSLNLWGTLIGALFGLPMGWLFDRFDHRLLLAGNLILLGISVLWMSTVTTWQELFVGVFLTRGLGRSALSVVSLTIVAKSFDAARLGIAMAWYPILAIPCHILLIKVVG